MKISIKIDCTPEEARKFLGFPDVSAANEAFAASMAAKMASMAEDFDAEALMKSWMPGGAPGMEEFQKAFWEQFSGSKPAGKGKK